MASAIQIQTKTKNQTSGPFVGILRALIAIFLIPATQLIVFFYSIDVGNSMTWPEVYSVPRRQHYYQLGTGVSSVSLIRRRQMQLLIRKNRRPRQETTMNSSMRMGFSAIKTLFNGGP